MTSGFFETNRNHLKQILPVNSMIVLFAGEPPKKSADEYYAFTPNRNFYYMCGIDEAQVKVVCIKKEETWEEHLFIRKPDPIREKWVGKTVTEEEAKSISGIGNIGYMEDFEDMLHRNLTYGEIESLYMDFEREAFNGPDSRELIFAKQCGARYPFVKIQNACDLIAKLRMIKSPEEIECIKKAIAITGKGIEALMKNARAGMMEYELEAHFDFVLKSNGIKDYAFKTIAASGKNATVLHYESNDSVIPEGSMILFDLGAQYQYYNADISRTIPVSGKFSERQKVFYEIVLEVQQRVIDAVKPGVTLRELNDIVKNYYFEKLSEIGMVKTPDEVSQYYYHGVGHFLGLDTHDVGLGKVPLEPGMVITVEPGLYMEEEGIGIRTEDNVLVTAEGHEVLSRDIIKTIKAVEEFMA